VRSCSERKPKAGMAEPGMPRVIVSTMSSRLGGWPLRVDL
jgi:hypothetical protein